MHPATAKCDDEPPIEEARVMMLHECPVCRRSQPWYTLLKPIWSRWHCRACGSLLSIDAKRRMMAMIPLLVVAVAAALTVPGMTGSDLMIAPVILAALVLCLLLFDRPLVIERAGFRCKRCGYDLRGQRDPQCPECGRALDAAERDQMELSDPAAIVQRERRRAGVWTRIPVVLVIGVLAFGVAVQIAFVLRVRTARIAAPTTTAPTSTSVPAAP